MSSFGDRLHAALEQYGRLCVGIDPHERLLRDWELPVSAEGARRFGLSVVEAAAGRVGVVKPQVSFFERFGAAGFAALEEVQAAARDAGLLVIADAKRGDIGTTMDAYAAAWLTPGAALEADALTVNPYLGVGALATTFALASRHGKGVFVLAATSNPDGIALQQAVPAAGGATVAAAVIAEVSGINAATAAPLADIGFVIGATVDLATAGVPAHLDPPAPILAPGFGAQGARLPQLSALFGALAPLVLASASRSILDAGPEGLALAIDAHNTELQEGLHV